MTEGNKENGVVGRGERREEQGDRNLIYGDIKRIEKYKVRRKKGPLHTVRRKTSINPSIN